MESLVVAVDIGGTFTDLAAYDTETGRFVFSKALTSYGSYISAYDHCAEAVGIDLKNCRAFKHGTTLVINALIQRKGAKTALVTTRGFRDILEIGRGNRAQAFNLRYRRDEPLIPRDMRFEVTERIDGAGRVIVPLDDSELEVLADRLRAMDVEAVAVSFLNAFRNPEHERSAAESLRRWLPNAFVTTGTDLTREWYEFERTATTAANAFVGPSTSRYLGGMERELRDRGYDHKLRLMSSAGGILSARQATLSPIELVESGPVGGLISAAQYAKALDLPLTIAFDMGGTTAKAATLVGGSYDVNTTYHIGGYDHGFPVRCNIVDIVEVGAGGGSIARLDGQMRLHVGPESAGSNPGPVAYGRGGQDPTVTDANIVLGRIDPGGLLGGAMALDVAGAARVIGDRIAEPLGFEGDEGIRQAATGILSIANVTMANALRKVTTERGHDPRKGVLLAYGGGGPLHAADLARELHLPTVVVPRDPSNFSALGMLLANVQKDAVRTFVSPLDPDSVRKLDIVFTEMEEELADSLRWDFGIETAGCVRYAELRYQGQMHTVRVALAHEPDTESIRKAFNETYRKRYGHVDEISRIEFVGLRASMQAQDFDVPLSEVEIDIQASRDVSTGHRRSVCFRDHGTLDVPVIERAALRPGDKGRGPVLVQEYGTTTVVGPADSYEIGAFGEIRISIGTSSIRGES